MCILKFYAKLLGNNQKNWKARFSFLLYIFQTDWKIKEKLFLCVVFQLQCPIIVPAANTDTMLYYEIDVQQNDGAEGKVRMNGRL